MNELETTIINSMATQIKVLEAEKAQLIKAFQSVVEERDALLADSKACCKGTDKKPTRKGKK
jgi:hypothetical protein